MFFALILTLGSPDCDNTDNQAEINECALIAYRAADAELNRQWPITLVAVRKSDMEMVTTPGFGSRERRLRDAQRAWITYRDAHCDSLYPYGSTMQLDYTQHVWCLTSLTQTRIEELQEIVASE